MDRKTAFEIPILIAGEYGLAKPRLIDADLHGGAAGPSLFEIHEIFAGLGLFQKILVGSHAMSQWLATIRLAGVLPHAGMLPGEWLSFHRGFEVPFIGKL